MITIGVATCVVVGVLFIGLGLAGCTPPVTHEEVAANLAEAKYSKEVCTQVADHIYRCDLGEVECYLYRGFEKAGISCLRKEKSK